MAVSNEERRRCAHYPVYLDMHGRHALVVGGGDVAARKAKSLIDAGAIVKVIALRPCDRIESWAREGVLDLDRRAYRPGDVSSVFLAYCATDDPSVNEAAYAEAQKRGILANVVDDPAHCSFIVPSVVRRGALQIAVSTGGCAPAMAKRVRCELEERYPEDLDGYIDLLGRVRSLVKERVEGGEAQRAPYFEAACDPSLLERYRAGELLDAEATFAEIQRVLSGTGSDRTCVACEAGGAR